MYADCFFLPSFLPNLVILNSHHWETNFSHAHERFPCPQQPPIRRRLSRASIEAHKASQQHLFELLAHAAPGGNTLAFSIRQLRDAHAWLVLLHDKPPLPSWEAKPILLFWAPGHGWPSPSDGANTLLLHHSRAPTLFFFVCYLFKPLQSWPIYSWGCLKCVEDPLYRIQLIATI